MPHLFIIARRGIATVLLSLCTPLLQTSHAGPLSDYINASDGAYSYRLDSVKSESRYTAYVLRLNSQKWRSSSEVSPTLWQHWLTVIVPKVVTTQSAHMLITGGSQTSVFNDNDALDDLAVLANATGAVLAAVSQVPAQPLKFRDHAQALTEDALVAYSWDKVLDTGDATWAAYLPMTKAVVKAMDAVQHFSKQRLNRTVKDFVVTGFSKRGATAWLVAATDKRVKAVVPGVFNVSPMADQIERHYWSYGEYSPAIHDYDDFNVLTRLRTKNGRLLTSLVDPIEYKNALTMPHYLLNATGDEFFQPDAGAFYLHKIPGETLQRIVPNTNHGLEDRVETGLVGLTGWYQTIFDGYTRPKINWKLLSNTKLQATTSLRPSKVTLWQATNANGRDFRHYKVGANAWKASSIPVNSSGKYTVSVTNPRRGYKAFMLEFEFSGGWTLTQTYTTHAFVTPNSYPFKPTNKVTPVYPDLAGSSYKPKSKVNSIAPYLLLLLD